MDFLFWIVFGLIAGTVANMIDPTPSQGGMLGSIVLGIIGSLVGGWIGTSLFGVGVSGFNLSSFIIAVLGSLVVLMAGRALTRRA